MSILTSEITLGRDMLAFSHHRRTSDGNPHIDNTLKYIKYLLLPVVLDTIFYIELLFRDGCHNAQSC
jgi:hypothetical protein